MECTFKLISKSGQPARVSKIHLLFADPSGERSGFQANQRSKTDTAKLRLYRKPDDPKMKIFCAVDSYKPKVIENYAPKKLTEIELEELSGGGGLVFSNAREGIPDFDGFLEIEPHPSGRSIKINAYYININGGQTQPVDLNIGEFAILEDESGKKVRLSVIGVIPETNKVLIEYQHLLPSSDLPAESDDWKPLSVDRTNPRKVESAEEAASSLGELNEELRGENGYIASKPEEYAAVSGDIGNLETKLKTEDIIDGDDIKKTFNAFKILAKIFNKVTRVGMKIVLATDRLVRFMEIVLNRIPENIRDFIKNIW